MPNGAGEPLVALDRDEVVVLARLEPGVVVDDARAHDADHLARDEALDLRRVGHLLADGDLEALLEEALHVRARGVVRHARHRDLVVRALVARGERQVERARGHDGVLEEELVEVAHAKEQERVRMRRLRVEVLAHHRRLRCVSLRHRRPRPYRG